MATNLPTQTAAGGALPAEMTTMTTIRQAPGAAYAPGAFTQVNDRRRFVVVGNAGTTVTRWSRFVAGCAEVARRAGRLLVRRRWELIPVGTTSGIAFLGCMQENAWATFGYSSFGAAGVTALVLGLLHKHPKAVEGGALVALGCGEIATWTAAGPSWPGVTAFAFATGLGYWHFGPWLKEHRDKRMKLHIDTVKAKGPVPGALGLEAADPGLVGSTAEETALRRAIHALTGATPLDVPAFHSTGNGWTALVVMPAGRNTSPDSIIRKRVQLANNLGMPGRLHLSKGDADNQLIVRLVTSDALAGTIPYEDDTSRSIKDPIQIGRDEHGRPVKISMLYRHTLIAGASDWGKSGIVNVLIKKIARKANVDMAGADMKPGSVELAPWQPYFCRRIAGSIEEARDDLDWLEAECHRRGEALGRESQERLARGEAPVRKWDPDVHGNALVYFIDEKAELIRQDEELRKLEAEWRKQDPDGYPLRKPVATQLESILAIARFVGIIVVASTQQPSRKVFGGSTDARGNYANRICTRMGESGHAQFIFGSDARSKGWKPELLDLPGKFLVCSPELENQTPRICRAEYVTDADIAADVAPLHAREARMGAPDGRQERDDDEAFFFNEAAPQPARMAKPAPPALRYPDGELVDVQPDLWRLFVEMQPTTKEELTMAGPFASRDTVRRALDVWMQHGVAARKEGRAEKFYIPGEEADGE